MKKLLASASFVVLGAASAMAADMPMKAAPYVAPVPVFSWTGCYIGVHAGAGVMRDTATNPVNFEGRAVRNNSSLSSGNGNGETGTGGLAGGQLGCNYQDGNWVIGVEGEGYWSGLKDKFGTSDSEGFDTLHITTRNKDDFSIAARAGIALDRTLIYGKAGWVWGKFTFSETDTCCSNFIGTTAANATLNGLLLGLGIEHALTQNWTVKLEYNYLRFGSKEVALLRCDSNSSSCFPNGTSTFSADKHIFKIGANYLFNWGGAPVVAKY
jgi:outer membrane immunogenic protein